MTLQEFKNKVGPRGAVIMECPGPMHYDGRDWKKGDTKNVTVDYAYRLHTRYGWSVKDGFVVEEDEAKSLNEHFRKVHEEETGGKPKTVKSKKSK